MSMPPVFDGWFLTHHSKTPVKTIKYIYLPTKIIFMVLEGLINPLKAEKKPWEMFFIGMVYASIALFLSLWIFEQHASLVMVFLVVMACIPLVYSTMKLEEKKDMEIEKESKLLKEHGKALTFLIFLFLGICVAFSIWYVFLPFEASQNAFSVQQQTITDINNQVTGEAINKSNLFFKIFMNNLKVLSFCILFSFVYGLGAIFILTWNASVIGVAIGNFIRSSISNAAAATGLSKIAIYFQAFSLGLFRYAIHGIPEIAAYFAAGLAGGIISIAIVNHDFRTKSFQRIVIDSADLILLAILILVVAGLLEVYLTPILF